MARNTNLEILAIDAHVHGCVDRAKILALRSVDLHDAESVLEEDPGPLGIGLHPWSIDPGTLDADLVTLSGFAGSGTLAALGETGLDRLRGPDLDLQIRAFRRHIELSELHDLPLVVHCVRSGSDALSLRKSMKARRPWIFHGWNGSPEQTNQILATNSVPSFGPALLDAHSKTRDLLRDLPLGAFLLETDDADIAIEDVEATAAEIRGETVPVLRAGLHQCWSKLFDLSAPAA